MKKLIVITAFIFTAVAAASAQGKFEPEVFESSEGVQLNYQKLKPIDTAKEQKYPLVIFLHGMGERGDDNKTQLTHGSQMFLNPANQEKYPAYVLFLGAAMLVSAFVLIGYIRLQSDITNSINHIAALESELNDLKLSNDEEYSRIESSINLEEIKRIAINELGMTYAGEGQIVEYSSEGSDYVRQVADIPN